MKIRTRIILILVLCIASGFYYLARQMMGDLRRRYLQAVEEVLVDQSQMLASLLSAQIEGGQISPDSFRQGFRELSERQFVSNIYGFFKNDVDQRVTVTDSAGRVVFDSDRGRDEGKDYSQWRDVHLTLQGFYGARSTRSDPNNPASSTIYVAAPIRSQGKIVGALTVAKPTRSVNLLLHSARSETLFAALFTAILVLLLGSVFSVWITRPIQRLTAYAKSIRDGKPKPFPKLGRSEIGEMGQAFLEMREALEGKKYVEEYVQNLTHELKSPLAAIAGATELLTEEMPSENRRHFLNNIRGECERMRQIVDKLLQLAALENQSRLEKAERLRLDLLLENLLDGYEKKILRSGIRIERQVAPDVSLLGDRFLLEQALVNLLDNAVDFSPSRSTILVKLERSDEAIKISVADEGAGIPDYAWPRLFEKFYSLPRPETGRKSTGLGLSFVREIAKLHGAAVRHRPISPRGIEASLIFSPIFHHPFIFASRE